MRPAKVLCSARQRNGSYRREEFVFTPEQSLEVQFNIEEVLDRPNVEENKRLIQEFKKTGQSGNAHFDARVRWTIQCLSQTVQWVMNHLGHSQ
jgi:hypothetical protein